MSEIKYRKGDYVMDIVKDHKYLYKVIKDISLYFWENTRYVGSEYVEPIGNTSDLIDYIYGKKGLDKNKNKAQYKVNYMNTALYKILHGDNYGQD